MDRKVNLYITKRHSKFYRKGKKQFYLQFMTDGNINLTLMFQRDDT